MKMSKPLDKIGRNYMKIKKKQFQASLHEIVREAQALYEGQVASYIPELAAVDPSYTTISVKLLDGTYFEAGHPTTEPFTLQSVSKLVVLIGILEELGLDEVVKVVGLEPSGDDFASVARLDKYGPKPSNPMLNAGAIALCSKIVGNSEEQIQWLEHWMTKCFGEKLLLNPKVFASERRTGDRNRSLAYLLKTHGIIQGNVDDILETYFASCSFEANIKQAVYLPTLLANGGKDLAGNVVLKEETVSTVVSIMTTCGLYNLAGTHLVYTGMPAKSGISGFIIALIPHQFGIAVFSPLVNEKGASVRGEYMLTRISQSMKWHFARKIEE